MESITAKTSPFLLFQRWSKEAVRIPLEDATAVALATASRSGQPSLRMVLYKGFDENGVTFFTNYKSRKSKELLANPRAALLFHWWNPHRQIRIEGKVKKISREESRAYFATRPRESQLGAWASDQSASLSNRETLLKKLENLDKKFAQEPIPCPAFWGGFILIPSRFEFWESCPARLHKRWLFKKSKKDWGLTLLNP